MVYSLSDSADGHFSIEETTGVIRLEKPLKDAQLSAFKLTVRATDRGSPSPLSTLSTVTVSVVDLNEYLPVFLSPEYMAVVTEDAAVGTEVLNLSALTRDGMEDTEIKYEIVNGNDHRKFLLNPRTGRRACFTAVNAGPFPRFAAPFFHLLRSTACLHCTSLAHSHHP